MLDSYLVYEKRIVAFVDILGFSTLIEDSKSDIVLRRKIKDSVELIHKSAEAIQGTVPRSRKIRKNKKIPSRVTFSSSKAFTTKMLEEH